MSASIRATVAWSLLLCLAPLGYAAKLGEKADPLSIATWVKGGPVTFAPSDTIETIYVIEFWATWCAPCRQSIPHLTEMQKKYRDKKVVMIGISDEDADTVRPYVDQMGETMEFVVAVDDMGKTSNGYMGKYGQSGIPCAFIVDKQGRVAWFGHPMLGLEEALAEVVAGTYDIAAEQHEREMRPVRERLFKEFLDLCKAGDPEKVNALAETMLKEHGTSDDLMYALGWVLLSHENEAIRNPSLALKVCKTSVDASKGKNPAALEVYARALFETGDVDGAIEQQKKAIALAPERVKAELEKVLNDYTAKRDKEAESPAV
jgi:thiol-disulfide isomerase/thioredoxin